MVILGISGKRESGKTSLANFLEQDHGFTRVSLANPLKEMCRDLYNLTDEQLYGTEKEVPTKYKRTDGSPLTARDILIREGCLKRSIDPLFWCKKLHDQIRFLATDKTRSLFVIDDIRFLNEIKYLKGIGTKFVRLERRQSAIGKAALDDLSETELDTYDEWDAVLLEDFNRDLEDLRRFSSYLVTRFLNPALYENH